MTEPTATRYRTLFVSDLHLGSRMAQADAFLDFLRNTEAETIYLVGDIVDFWKVRRRPYWPQPHNDVLQKLLRTAREGTRLVVVPGNHDEVLRDYCGVSLGAIEFHREYVHTSATGKRYLVLHGDEFDVVIRSAKILAHLGDWAYELALWLTRPVHWVRRKLGYDYWSLSAYLKYRVKHAVAFIGSYEHVVARHARRRDVDGVICGHIHHAADMHYDEIHYLNCGDWVESCSAIGETHSGEFKIIQWFDPAAASAAGEPESADFARAA